MKWTAWISALVAIAAVACGPVARPEQQAVPDQPRSGGVLNLPEITDFYRESHRKIYKAALGTAEFFYRSLHLPREALPWFARQA